MRKFLLLLCLLPIVVFAAEESVESVVETPAESVVEAPAETPVKAPTEVPEQPIEQPVEQPTNQEETKENTKQEVKEELEKEESKKEEVKQEPKVEPKQETKSEQPKKQQETKTQESSPVGLSSNNYTGENITSTNSKTDENYAYKEESKFFDPEILTKLRYPLSKTARFTSGFGYRSFDNDIHTGIDLAIETGTPVLAAESGEITFAGWSTGYGNRVDIKHKDGMLTRYGHMSEVNVKVGQKVIRGQQIGKVGSTGNSTGPHLHFEVRPDGMSAVDPLPYLSSLASDEESEYAAVNFRFLDGDKLLFSLFEYFTPEYVDDTTVIDISKYKNIGLIKDVDDKIVLEGKQPQSTTTIDVQSSDIQRKNVLVSIDGKSSLQKFSPLFDMIIDYEGTERDKLYVKIDGKEFTNFDYKDNKLIINYSCLYVDSIEISTGEKRELDEYNYESINRISSWIEIDKVDPLIFNSNIECYVIDSLSSAEVKTNYLLPPYNKYNMTKDNSVLIDNALAGGYISIPKKVVTLTSEVSSDISTEEDAEVKIDDEEYNIFIQGIGEVVSGKATVEFKLVDYFSSSEYNYYIVSYNVGKLGGYFGFKTNKG